MRKRNACPGFTLIELCFGLAIVGILAGLAIPSLRSALRASAVRSAVFELAAGIQQARAGSIVEARPAVLCLSDSAGNCLGNGGPSAAWRSFLEAGGRQSALTLRTLPSGVALYATRPQLTFWPHSLAASTVTLTICDLQNIARPRAIILSQSGRARVADAAPERCP